jgi:hypothetical protein
MHQRAMHGWGTWLKNASLVMTGAGLGSWPPTPGAKTKTRCPEGAQMGHPEGCGWGTQSVPRIGTENAQNGYGSPARTMRIM